MRYVVKTEALQQIRVLESTIEEIKRNPNNYFIGYNGEREYLPECKKRIKQLEKEIEETKRESGL